MALLTLMLKTIRSLDSTPEDNENEVAGAGGDRNLFKSKKSKNAKSGIQTCIRAIGELMFLTSSAREAFN